MRFLLTVWWIALLALTNYSAVAPSYPQQADQTITVDAYWDLVRATRQSVAQMAGKPETEIRSTLNELAAQWEPVTAVEFPDHGTLRVSTAYLVAELRKDPPHREQLENRLDALLNAHQAFPQRVFTLEDMDPLKDVLARPEFQWKQAQSVQLPSWLANIMDTLSEVLDRITYALSNLLYEGRYIWMIAAAVLFALTLLFVSRSLSRSLVRDAQFAEQGSENEGNLTSKGAIQRAQTLSMQGDYRNAIRYLYLSSLLVLDEQGLLRYDRSRTNREYLRSISSRPELAKPLQDVIDVFDRVWYGFEDVDDQTYNAYREHVDELREKKE